jgi:hypothetical protein
VEAAGAAAEAGSDRTSPQAAAPSAISAPQMAATAG